MRKNQNQPIAVPRTSAGSRRLVDDKSIEVSFFFLLLSLSVSTVENISATKNSNSNAEKGQERKKETKRETEGFDVDARQLFSSPHILTGLLFSRLMIEIRTDNGLI